MIAPGLSLVEFTRSVYLPGHFLRPRSAAQILNAAEQYEAWAGVSPVAAVTDETLTGFLKYLSGNGKAAATVNTRRRQLLSVTTYAWRKRATPDLPRDVPRMQEPQRIPEAWTIDEVQSLLAYSARLPGFVGETRAAVWWPALVSLCYWTGARIGDVIGTETRAVDLGRGTWLCRASKTGKERLYRLHPVCVRALAAIHRPGRRLLFAWPHSPNHLFWVFRRIVQGAGIRYDGRHCQLFHRLRRTNASYCWAADPAIAQQQMGHSSQRVTAEHYVDPSICRERTAADVLPVPEIGDRQGLLF